MDRQGDPESNIIDSGFFYAESQLLMMTMKSWIRLNAFLLFLCFFPFSASAGQISDIRGVEIPKGKVFSRIISLYPAHTENLATLGCAELLVGISKSDTFPESIRSKTRFSYRDNPEKFIAASPDLILVRPMIVRAYPQLLSRLQDAGITVVSLQPRSVEGIYIYWNNLAALVGKEQAAGKMVAEFKTALAKYDVQNSAILKESKPWIYFESIHSKMKTIAPKSIAAAVLKYGGGRNIAADATARNNTNISAYGKEHILSHAANIDIYLAQKGRMNQVSVEDIITEPGFASIKAVQQGQVYLIDEHLVSRPTMRLLKGIERVREIIRLFESNLYGE
jgi:iron complex transport system substrate-binding protein